MAEYIQHDKADENIHLRLPEKSQASACGKTILIGEHAVVYGARAVAMPLKQMKVVIELRPAMKAAGQPQVLFKLGDTLLSRHATGIVDDAMKLLSIPPFDLSIAGQSKLPVGGGLGSSAALCVVVLRSLAKSIGIKLTEQELATYANKLETRFHGTPSGIDTAVVAYEHCICFRKQPALLTSFIPYRTKEQKPWKFALIDSRVRASTLTMIRIAAPYFGGAKGQKRLERFDNLSAAVMASITSNDILAVGAAMSEAAVLLRESGIVTPVLQGMIERVKKIGVLAAKTTGSGGGGFILALLDPDHCEGQCAQITHTFGVENVHFTELS